VVKREAPVANAGACGPRAPSQGYPACSFCDKPHTEAYLLVAGPLVFICDECVGLCVEILDEKRAREAAHAKPG
jgi:hypothetical protein